LIVGSNPASPATFIFYLNALNKGVFLFSNLLLTKGDLLL